MGSSGDATSAGPVVASVTGASGGAETSSEDPTSGGAETSAETTQGTGEDPVIDLPALQNVNDGRFATSEACTDCHTADASSAAMRDEAGRDVSPYALWQASMMANAARDPYWWAMVRAEGAATPSKALEIEGECTRCHAPVAAVRPELWEDTPMSLDGLLADNDRAQLGLDGVSCSGCHKIGSDDIEGESQWSGHLDLRDEPQMMGPHADPFPMPMSMHTGFEPVEAAHFDSSAVCAGCHTLDTQTLTPQGEPAGGHFSEQSPYLEWLNSGFSTEVAEPGPQARSCQDCHMPSESEDGVPISTRIARRPSGGDFPPVSERSPYNRHTFLGGNTLVPAMLRDNAETLRPIASSDAFDAVIAQTLDQLRNRTATVALTAPGRNGDTLEVTARVENLTGHKFPSGFPSRRAWLEVVVTDADGDTVFHSGGVDDQGRLVDAEGAVLATEMVGAATQPHFDVIDGDSDVQIWQTVMAGVDGDPVFRLLRADSDFKDNRILPDGWRTDSPFMDRIAPQLGVADDDFVGGRDDVTYRFTAPVDAGPYAIEARLLYQPLSARFAAELFALDAPEIRAFEAMWDAADRTPAVVATAQVEG